MNDKAKSVFSRIIDGEIPSHKLYEDEFVYSFLDVNPLSPGHALVVPKEPAKTLDELSEQSAQAIGRVLPKISRAILNATKTKEFNILQNNGPNAHQSVFHVHFHIIPKTPEGLGLEIPFITNPLDHDEARRLTIEIRKNLD
ncbi:MAG: diadenosine tetraphosphate hydrolase [Euryarchaeota archaeon]|nr:diadenosine tetraphosphate hydrolase [Euryarchaeota archaeon]